MAYSTNETLPDLKEVINRLNIIEIFGKVFKADKFKYHEVDKGNNDNLKELSLILPEFLKYDIKDVLEIYDTAFAILENSDIEDTQKRVINNLAYAYTGILLLLDISGVQIDELDEKIIDYARKQIKKYEEIKNVVDKVLAEIPVLLELGVLINSTHFRVSTETLENGNSELQIHFNKDIILSIINKYYAHDKSKHINDELFKSYAKNHPRYRGNKTVRYKEERGTRPTNSMTFCISGLEEYEAFGSMPVAISAQELADNLKGNQM